MSLHIVYLCVVLLPTSSSLFITFIPELEDCGASSVHLAHFGSDLRVSMQELLDVQLHQLRASVQLSEI